jgi:hypothetical protein
MTHASNRANESPHIGVWHGLLFALLPMAISVAVGAKTLPSVLAGGLVNPDSYMRLVRLESELRHHDVGYIVAREGSGAGTPLHWSHLLDMLLWLLATPFHLVMGTNDALHAGAVVFGLVCMGALGAAMASYGMPKVLTIGLLYHRNVAAFIRARAAWRSAPSDTVSVSVRATKATLLLFCPSTARSMLVADLPSDTLLDRLKKGQVLPRLRPVSEDPRSGYLLYEVMP